MSQAMDHASECTCGYDELSQPNRSSHDAASTTIMSLRKASSSLLQTVTSMSCASDKTQTISLNKLPFSIPACPTHPENANHLPFLSFNALDNLLFANALRGNVHLRWQESIETGETYHGYTSASKYEDSRVCITLNTALQRKANWKGDIFAALVHHMVHAYLLICCGYHHKKRNTDVEPPTSYDLTHSLEFVTLLSAINHILVTPDFRYPELLACTPEEDQWVAPPLKDGFVAKSGKSKCNWYATNFPSEREIRGCFLKLWEETDKGALVLRDQKKR